RVSAFKLAYNRAPIACPLSLLPGGLIAIVFVHIEQAMASHLEPGELIHRVIMGALSEQRMMLPVHYAQLRRDRRRQAEVPLIDEEIGSAPIDHQAAHQ